jgi:hypothetical protein
MRASYSAGTEAWQRRNDLLDAMLAGLAALVEYFVAHPDFLRLGLREEKAWGVGPDRVNTQELEIWRERMAGAVTGMRRCSPCASSRRCLRAKRSRHDRSAAPRDGASLVPRARVTARIPGSGRGAALACPDRCRADLPVPSLLLLDPPGSGKTAQANQGVLRSDARGVTLLGETKNERTRANHPRHRARRTPLPFGSSHP